MFKNETERAFVLVMLMCGFALLWMTVKDAALLANDASSSGEVLGSANIRKEIIRKGLQQWASKPTYTLKFLRQHPPMS